MKTYLKFVVAFVLGQLTGLFGIGTLASAAIDALSAPAKVFDTLRIAVLDGETPREVMAEIKENMHPGIKVHSIQPDGDSILVNVASGKGEWAANCLEECGLEPDEIVMGGYGEVGSEGLEALSADWI